MTNEELREHIALRESLPGGTIARASTEKLAGHFGETIRDVNPMALAFISAAHPSGCDCRFCA